jgi:heat shock protein HtpX
MNQLKTLLLLGVLSAMFIAIGGYLGPQYLYLFAGMSVLMNFAAYFWSDKLVLRLQRAREVTPAEAPKLHRIVDELIGRAGLPKPRVYIVPMQQPNAFATGRNPEHAAIAASEGILRLLDERELRAVIAHELAHVKNRDILIATIAAAIASAITYIANAVQWSAMFGGSSRDDDERGSPLGALAFAIVAPLAATLVQLAISRAREFQADKTGAEMCGDPEALARALEKIRMGVERMPAEVVPATASLFIANPLSGRAVLSLFSTHPDMEERVRRLRAMR